MSKIILLGASGFVGRTLTPMLEKHELKYVAPSSTAINLTEVGSVSAIADLVRDGDTVIMLAAHTPEKGNAAELTPKNLAMMQHLLLGIKGRSIAQLIYVSSDAVYPMTSDIIDEQTPAQPYDLYGMMHLMREQYARQAVAPEILTILRPCAIYGPGDTHHSYSINRFIRTALTQGEITLFGDGEEYRDHIYCEDFARVILTIQQNKIAGLFNVATGTSWRFRDIAAQIQTRVGNHVRIIHKPRAIPVTHRHFHTATLLRSIPSPMRSIPAGIEAFLVQPAAAA